MQLAFALLIAINIGVNFMNIPPVLAELMGLYHVSYTHISLLMSALLWSHAIMQIPAGIIADRIGIKRSFASSLIFFGLGNLILTSIPHLGWAVLGRVVIGVGTGLSFVTGIKFSALSAPPGRAGTYQAFFGGFFAIGGIAAYLLFPFLISLGWRWVYLKPGLLSIFLLIILSTLRIPSPPVLSFSLASLHSILRMKEAWGIGIYHTLTWSLIINLGNWVPSLLSEALGHSTATKLAWGGVLIMLTSGIGRLLGGVILLRWSPLFIAHGSMVVLTLTLASLFMVPSPTPLLVLSISAAWFSSICFGALFHLASRAIPADSLATMIGFINSMANFGAVFVTLMFGWVKDTAGTFSWGFAILAALSFASILFGRTAILARSS